MNRKLRGRIREICGSEKVFAQALGISQTALSTKANRHTEWKGSQIAKAVEVLQIPKKEVWAYFFEEDV